jgi:RNA polymerase sigma-70 factor (ECF subfamily)
MAPDALQSENVDDVRDFHEQLKAILPRLRVYALSLTRDRDAADDLVHDTVIKALTGRKSFEPGTNLSAWVFRIQRNEFISGLRVCGLPYRSIRRRRDLSHQPHQESRLIMREFMSAFGSSRRRSGKPCCSPFSRPVVRVKPPTGVSVGLAESRISRARDTWSACCWRAIQATS